jgi:excisionase family DNA binding protein
MPKVILGVELYELKEVAQLLGVTIQTIRRYVRVGYLTPTLVGKTKYISAEALREYLTHTKRKES